MCRLFPRSLDDTLDFTERNGLRWPLDGVRSDLLNDEFSLLAILGRDLDQITRLHAGFNVLRLDSNIVRGRDFRTTVNADNQSCECAEGDNPRRRIRPLSVQFVDCLTQSDSVPQRPRYPDRYRTNSARSRLNFSLESGWRYIMCPAS